MRRWSQQLALLRAIPLGGLDLRREPNGCTTYFLISEGAGTWSKVVAVVHRIELLFEARRPGLLHGRGLCSCIQSRTALPPDSHQLSCSAWFLALSALRGSHQGTSSGISVGSVLFLYIRYAFPMNAVQMLGHDMVTLPWDTAGNLLQLGTDGL